MLRLPATTDSTCPVVVLSPVRIVPWLLVLLLPPALEPAWIPRAVAVSATTAAVVAARGVEVATAAASAASAAAPSCPQPREIFCVRGATAAARRQLSLYCCCSWLVLAPPVLRTALWATLLPYTRLLRWANPTQNLAPIAGYPPLGGSAARAARSRDDGPYTLPGTLLLSRLALLFSPPPPAAAVAGRANDRHVRAGQQLVIQRDSDSHHCVLRGRGRRRLWYGSPL